MFENNEENRNSSYHCYKHPRSQCLQQRRQRSYRKTDAGDVTKGELYTNMKKTAGASVLTQLVQEKVLDKKYKVSDKEIDNKLKEYKTQLGDQYTALEKQYGKDYLKEQVKYELLTQKAAKDNIKVTDADIKEYWEGLKGKIRASHILVADKKTAEEVEKKLKKARSLKTLRKNTQQTALLQKAGILAGSQKKAKWTKHSAKLHSN